MFFSFFTPRFASNEEFFQAVEDLIARLERSGFRDAARELREGYGCINGLTDGAALFLESIKRVRDAWAGNFSREDRSALNRIHAAAHRAVCRR